MLEPRERKHVCDRNSTETYILFHPNPTKKIYAVGCCYECLTHRVPQSILQLDGLQYVLMSDREFKAIKSRPVMLIEFMLGWHDIEFKDLSVVKLYNNEHRKYWIFSAGTDRQDQIDIIKKEMDDINAEARRDTSAVDWEMIPIYFSRFKDQARPFLELVVKNSK